MADKVIPFPTEPRGPLLTQRWRAIVNVNGTLHALDVAAVCSLLSSPPAAVGVVQPAETAAGAAASEKKDVSRGR
jgi:hypothetical protein